MTSIDSNYLLSTYQQEQSMRTNNGDYLGKDAFLKLLMTQLQNQDPTSPMDDKEFISQMAQFSTLEQMANMASSFEQLAILQQQSQLITYNQFVGKEVKWHKVEAGENPEDKPTIKEGTGTIQSIQYVEGSVVFTLTDGTKLEPANISEVLSSSSGSSLVEASELIGKKVTWKDEDKEFTAIVTSVSYKDGKIVYELNDENKTKITADKITQIGS